MTLSEQYLPTFDNMLGTLDGLLAKAAGVDGSGGGDALLAARLAPDMLPLAAQVRIACDQVSGALKRLSDSTFMLPDDDDTTIAEARARIAKTREAAKSQPLASFVAPDAPVELNLPNGLAFALSAQDYARDWAQAQLYFHVVTAFAILRNQGLAIGKIDYMGFMAKYAKAPAPA